MSEALKVLAWYADQFCEFGRYNTGCGKYDSDICAGCKARSVINSTIPPRDSAEDRNSAETIK